MAWLQCKSKTSKSLTQRCCFKSAFGLTAKNSIGRIFCLASLFIKVIGRDPRYHDQYFMKSKFKHHRWSLCPNNWLDQSDRENSCLPTFLHVCQNWSFWSLTTPDWVLNHLMMIITYATFLYLQFWQNWLLAYPLDPMDVSNIMLSLHDNLSLPISLKLVCCPWISGFH